MSLQAAITQYRARVESKLDHALSHSSIEPCLQDAMRYGLFNGGKRVRPLLVYLINDLLGGRPEQADAAACAIEAMHSYSLIHDDLPAMDNDDLRRGKPTCHIVYGEATAILAGDALQCFAFELLAGSHLPPERIVRLISTLAKASGDTGMVAGQAFDLSHVGQSLSLTQLEAMHRCKTGALINASIEMGYYASGCTDTNTLSSLLRYGQAIGLAFQVKDDILDIEGDTETLGKPQGSDLELNKPTYPSLLGMDSAKTKLADLHQTALDTLASFGDSANTLKALADYITHRSH
ncbi:polyprenyl synthetase family protein [Neptunomonas concharum]|uniref:Geranyl transferase n=1 Tax=Neptunomonas concharum TaxID=1031538 RepID=A0A5P1R7N0_9GAMM|nr:farnesyl diphosphate synthase [Neptunomonas concharum]QEQ95563.1 geranyl transferase [Neptunomonas concharum]